MKTNKILATLVAVTLITALGLSSVSAYGQGGGQGGGQGAGSSSTEEERTELQNMTEEEKQAYMEEK